MKTKQQISSARSTKKREEKLGMNDTRARKILNKDLLFHFAKQLNRGDCYRCGKEMKREDFTVDHIENWLNSDDPISLFFDIDNIAFSHLSCNRSAQRTLISCPSLAAYKQGCRCDECRLEKSRYSKEYRARKKLKTSE